MLSGPSRIGYMALAVAAATLTAAGCTASHNTAAPKPASSSSVSATQAIKLAASYAQRVTSFAADINVQTTGTEATSFSGTMAERTQPSLLLAMNVGSISAQGQTVPGGIQEIINSSDIYLKMAQLSRLSGKPWIRMPFSEISKASGINLSQLFQQAESNNPLVQTQMLASSANVRKAGTATIDGVQTTEYAGSYPISAGLARLPADLRAKLAPQMQAMGLGSSATFRLWLDNQQRVRKVIVSDQGSKEQLTSSIQVTSINQPVTVTLPPPSQTATVPANALGNG
ncbi:MAG TPA: hypothetical protein VE733_26325 [Streptosporangiaceae bacterium]|nr:hypothetical protein [Streptosporangiaceae bacterium]